MSARKSRVSPPIEESARCTVAANAVNEMAHLLESLVGPANRCDDEERALIMAVVVRGRQLLIVASTMLCDSQESVEGKQAIVDHGSDEPCYQPSTSTEAQGA